MVAASALCASIALRRVGDSCEALVGLVERGERSRTQAGFRERSLVGAELAHRGIGPLTRLVELRRRRATAGDVPRRHDTLVLQRPAGVVERAVRAREVAVLLLRVEGVEPVAQPGRGDDDEGEERHEEHEQQLGAEAQPRHERLASLQA